jgi:hypothetical protein
MGGTAAGLSVSIDWWHLVGAIASLIGAFYALVKIIVAQFNKNLDIRFAAQEQVRSNAQGEWARRFTTLEDGQRELDRRFNEHLVELPLKYQRREDAIRQEVNIISRLDGLAGLFEERFKQMDQKIERRRQP